MILNLVLVYSYIKKITMYLIKKIHYYIIFLSLRAKKIDPAHSKVMAEQYIYFYYN